MAGDVNLFFDDDQQDVAEIEIMIAGTTICFSNYSTLSPLLHLLKAHVTNTEL